MPEDERASPPADLTGRPAAGPRWLELLEAGEVEVEGRMPWSSNVTLLASVQLGERSGRAIYKPAAGERPLSDFPDGLYRREVAAYELSTALELSIVPETVLRADAPFGPGSLQRFVEADFEQHYFTLLEDPALLDALRLVAGFDLLVNNADRKGGHLLLDAERHVWAIDNGLCFHRSPKLRTVMWDFAGEPLPAALVAGCEQIARGVPARLGGLLDAAEVASLAARARRLLERPSFPVPDVERRPYPWPLV